MTPDVSIIIPTYNRASFIGRAVESVLTQSFKNWELIIVDDGSTDNTQDFVKIYENQPKIKLLKTENRGVSAARNLGVQQALGTWIAFLDSDDQWLPEKLEKQMKESRKNPEISIIHGDEIWIRRGVRANPMKKHQKKGGDLFHQALGLCCISPSTVLIRKRLFNEAGGFREDFPVCEDYDLWLRITSRYPVTYINDFLIKKYGGHRDQLSIRYKAMDYWRVLSISSCLSSIPLSHEKQIQAKKELCHKANILLKGYRKHGNLENFDRIFAILNFYGDDDSSEKDGF